VDLIRGRSSQPTSASQLTTSGHQKKATFSERDVELLNAAKPSLAKHTTYTPYISEPPASLRLHGFVLNSHPLLCILTPLDDP